MLASGKFYVHLLFHAYVYHVIQQDIEIMQSKLCGFRRSWIL